MFYDLLSVSCCIDAFTLIIYKINKDGTRKKWRHLDKCSDRWFSSLSDFDFGTIDTLVNVR